MLFSDISLIKENESEELLRLKPEGYNYFYNQIISEKERKVNKINKHSKYSWVLHKDRSTDVMTEYDYISNTSFDAVFHTKSHLSRETCTTFDLEAVSVKFESNKFEVRNNEYDNFKLREAAFSKTSSLNIVLYTPYMIINKTGLNLILGNGKKRNDIEIRGKSVQYFNPKGTKKLFIKAEDYSWSKEFDFTTVGISGQLSLQASK